MEAMVYESLLRSVYNCGRSGKKGADADIYRKMEMAERFLTDTNWNKPKHEKEYDFRKAFVEVKTYVRKALIDGLKQVQTRASKEEIERIETMEATLQRLDFFNKIELDIIVDTADEIFSKNGLKEG
jgi:hypothetical protein